MLPAHHNWFSSYFVRRAYEVGLMLWRPAYDSVRRAFPWKLGRILGIVCFKVGTDNTGSIQAGIGYTALARARTLWIPSTGVLENVLIANDRSSKPCRSERRDLQATTPGTSHKSNGSQKKKQCGGRNFVASVVNHPLTDEPGGSGSHVQWRRELTRYVLRME
ncbi:uncharacterized protein CIMG_13532 [Coccidioides immitis RS]|uniref:Uncharacterized protein n=1 Tax=Coccidioides immitis (strain RS) TaxID=246410 RepID=A0A0D8JVV8_COCIM|nr:uncharacterized protein CIMG_13532 [Coccidioides immitis RS]KJF61239.1 hypothetical protein CIMG_13532 [Coccidioides immitis RS]